MKRYGLCAWAVAVGLAGGVSAQEVQWRAVGAPKVVRVTAQAPASPARAIDQLPVPFPGQPPQAEPLASPRRMPTAATPVPAIVSTPTSVPMLPDCPCPPAAPVCCPTPEWRCWPQLAACRVQECCNFLTNCWNDPGVLGGTWFGNAAPANERFFVRGEFLSWWVKSAGTPVLLTTSTTQVPFTINGNGNVVIRLDQLDAIGALGQPGTVVLLSGDDLDRQYRPGARFSAGWWFDPCGVHGVDASAFFTGRRTSNYTVNTDHVPDLYRPFFAPNTGIPSLNNLPGQFREIVGIRNIGINGQFVAQNSSFFWGADVNYRRNIWCGCAGRIDAFAGFRYLNLDESLTMTEAINVTRTIVVQNAAGTPIGQLNAGTTIAVRDRFATDNNFFGGQLGLDIALRRNRWTLDVRPALALGVTHQRVCVDGSFVQSSPPVNAVGGLLALNSNIGCRGSDEFSVVPQVTTRVGYQVTERFRAFVGYDFLYWTNVVRPGDQIDTVLDTRRIPGGPGGDPINAVRPAPLINSSDFWAQGLSLGAEYRW
jgi:hypothetical protein